MDPTDMGTAVEAANTEAAINAVRLNARISSLPNKGECYSCEAPLTDRNFCDKECRDDYEELNRKLKYGRTK